MASDRFKCGCKTNPALVYCLSFPGGVGRQEEREREICARLLLSHPPHPSSCQRLGEREERSEKRQETREKRKEKRDKRQETREKKEEERALRQSY